MLNPWVKKGYLETKLYSQVNILKTTEAIFGLPPMSQWDENAGVVGVGAQVVGGTPQTFFDGFDMFELRH